MRVKTLGKMIFLRFILFAGLIFCSSSAALDVPFLKGAVNDFAGMIPQPSVENLEERLRDFKTRTGYSVVVLTVPSLEDENLESLGRKAFKNLPSKESDLRRSILLLVAMKEHKVGVQTGADLRPLFPEPSASRKLKDQVELYINGLRPDLGIHGAIHYIFRVIDGEVRVGSTTEEEKWEERSLRGGGAGAILAVFLAPFLAFMVGTLWGIYATKVRVETMPRLFMGALLGGGTAKTVELLMSLISSYGDGLWYFILAISMVLGIFGSLTEYWMAGSDWSGIPRVKDRSLTRKPTDKMGI